MKNYYDVLGINKNASDEEVKKAYRRLAHQHHPDRPGGNESKFKEINEAYQVLSNQEKRYQYDQFGQTFDGGFNPFGGAQDRPFGGFGGGAWEFGFDPSAFENVGSVEDIFDAFFEGVGMKRRKTYQRGSDLEVALTITLEEAFAGAEKTITFDTLIACGQCAGLGHFAKEGLVKCATCDGKGEVKENRSGFFGSFSQIRRCYSCNGTGQIPNKKCSDCSGTGRMKQSKSAKVVVAPGVRDSQIIKLTGLGEAGERGAAAGDLYIKVKVKPHAVFQVKGEHLLMKKEINLLDVLLGKKIAIKGIDGKEIAIEIPAGANLSGELRIAGAGMPYLGARLISRRGDLFVFFDLIVPKKLSAKAKKLLEELKKEIG